MTSGLIYIAIIGMWVAYFAPRWIHDRNEFSGKSVERFKGALRVVANQTPNATTNGGAIHIDLDQEAKNRQTLLRRRITFLLITFTLTMTLVGGAMNTMPFIYALVPASGLLIYIASVRRHVISDQLQKRRVQQLNRQSSGVSNTNLAEVVQPKPSTEHWIPLSERELKGVVILPQGTAAVRNAWNLRWLPSVTNCSCTLRQDNHTFKFAF